MHDPIPWLDRAREYRCLQASLLPLLDKLLAQGGRLLDRAVTRFETAFADFVGAPHCIGLNSGVTALRLALEACGVGPGAEVITVPVAATATATAIAATGARPVFVDIEPGTYCMNPALIEPALTSRTRAVVPVHLYGQMADMLAINAVAQRHKLAVVEDASQAHGATLHGRHAGTFGRAGCFSFHPGKNLSADRDAGAIVTNDGTLAGRLRQLSDHVRMEEFAAALLSIKLPHLPAWTASRRELGRRYTAELANLHSLYLPVQRPTGKSCCHIYAIRTPARNALRTHLAKWRIQTAVHYPTPLHLQPAFRQAGCTRGAFPVAEALCATQLTLPLFPELNEREFEHVIDAVQGWAAAVGSAVLVAA
ncbi:hypothetical protein AYO44_08295 [Planctomycetaceae bacterium SCGC AG-212-F19]|nr:hypothetical protein AYO44_08295 [Planctomycetaceae bacterium SCGC AG-212-F19]